MKLEAKNVSELIKKVLIGDDVDFSPDNVPDSVVLANATMAIYAFDKVRLEEARANVISMLEELPDQFMKEGGGGWSLMNMPFSKDNVQWGEQIDADRLFALANGLGLAKFLLPREMWGNLPGGMPYVMICTSGVE